jgi:hypothetical protein
MADSTVKKKIYKVLREGYFSDPDDAVDPTFKDSD